MIAGGPLLIYDKGLIRKSKTPASTRRLLQPQSLSPNSFIILNSGTRTILHTNLGLPELTESDFESVQVSDYAWIHFEGRPNLVEVKKMLQLVKGSGSALTKTSLEMEKLGRNYDPLLPYVDVIFVLIQQRGWSCQI